MVTSTKKGMTEGYLMHFEKVNKIQKRSKGYKGFKKNQEGSNGSNGFKSYDLCFYITYSLTINLRNIAVHVIVYLTVQIHLSSLPIDPAPYTH